MPILAPHLACMLQYCTLIDDIVTLHPFLNSLTIFVCLPFVTEKVILWKKNNGRKGGEKTP